MRIEDIKECAHVELVNLRKHATKDEIDKLVRERFFPTNRRHCVYGQMTGDCFSTRAHELIRLCAPVMLEGHLRFDTVFKKVAISTVETRKDGRMAYSPVEVLLMLYYGKGKFEKFTHILNFLKGTGKTVRL